MNPYFYLYYKIYNTMSKTNKIIPEWSASIAISLLFFFNLSTIALYFKINGIEVLPVKEVYISILILFMALNFYLFVRKDNYKRILKKYSGYKRDKLGTFLVIIYLAVTIIAFAIPFI